MACAAHIPTEKADSESPVSYYSATFPAWFTIGSKRTDGHLVTANQIQGHLLLLRAFSKLWDRVQALSPSLSDLKNGIIIPQRMEERWIWFLELAVERFEKWMSTLPLFVNDAAFLRELPPVDVLMVWHAYLLSPGWYAEDCLRIKALSRLTQYNNVWTTSLGSIGGIVSGQDVSVVRIRGWTQQTSLNFDPLETNAVTKKLSASNKKELLCPKCGFKALLDMATPTRTGYLQDRFTQTCKNCKAKITRERLIFRKLLNDLACDMDGSYSGYMAGTLRTPLIPMDIHRGESIKKTLLKATLLEQRTGRMNGKRLQDQIDWENSVIDATEFSLPVLRENLKLTMKGTKWDRQVFDTMMKAYDHHHMFSVDLAGAVQRHMVFIKQLARLGWVRLGAFAHRDFEVFMQFSIARYHAFIDLVAASPDTHFVPTLDIDLVWHTHQLMANSYRVDCMTYVGRLLDHEDAVEEEALFNAFDTTSRAWEERFGTRYTYCGCPLPGETLSKISRNLSNRPILAPLPNHDFPLEPPASSSFSLYLATHPSDHNAVPAEDDLDTIAARKARILQLEYRRQLEVELCTNAQGGSQDNPDIKALSEILRRGTGHDMPFVRSSSTVKRFS